MNMREHQVFLYFYKCNVTKKNLTKNTKSAQKFCKLFISCIVEVIVTATLNSVYANWCASALNVL